MERKNKHVILKGHLGHYKCLLIPDNNNDDITISDLNNNMLHIHNVMINLSLSLGAPLNRLTTLELIMIPKELNNIPTNRLRLINLYEADYNLVLKFVWSHKSTKLADKLGLLEEGQWGTKPLYSAE